MAGPPVTTWEAPPPCPAENEVNAAISARLGGGPLEPWGPPVVRARVVRRGLLWSADVQVREGAGVEHWPNVTAPSCEEIAAIIIERAVEYFDPFLEFDIDGIGGDDRVVNVPVQRPKPQPERREDEGAAVRVSTSLAPAAVLPAVVDEGESTTSVAVTGFVNAAGGLGFNLLPQRVHGSARVELGLERGLLRLALVGAGHFAARYRVQFGTEHLDGSLSAWALGLLGCGVPRWGRWSLRACASVGAGQMIVSRGTPAYSPWPWLGATVGAGVEVGARTRVFVDLGPLFDLARPQLVFTEENSACVAADSCRELGRVLVPVVFAVAVLGVELGFPASERSRSRSTSPRAAAEHGRDP